MSEKIKNFRTKNQREFDRVCDRSEENLKAYEKMMEKKRRKAQLAGELSEDDIDEIIRGMGTLAKDSKDRREQLRKINPEEVEKLEEDEKRVFSEAWEAAKEEYYEKEHGVKIVK